MTDLKATDVTRFIMPGKVKTINASVTLPENAGLRFILNPCSINGKWESKLQKVLSKRWKKPQEEFKTWAANTTNFKLGQIQSVSVQSDVWVINIICLNKEGKLDQKGFADCLKNSMKLVKSEKASVHVSSLTGEFHENNLDIYAKDFSTNGIHTYFYTGDQ